MKRQQLRRLHERLRRNLETAELVRTGRHPEISPTLDQPHAWLVGYLESALQDIAQEIGADLSARKLSADLKRQLPPLDWAPPEEDT